MLARPKHFFELDLHHDFIFSSIQEKTGPLSFLQCASSYQIIVEYKTGYMVADKDLSKIEKKKLSQFNFAAMICTLKFNSIVIQVWYCKFQIHSWNWVNIVIGFLLQTAALNNHETQIWNEKFEFVIDQFFWIKWHRTIMFFKCGSYAFPWILA